MKSRLRRLLPLLAAVAVGWGLHTAGSSAAPPAAGVPDLKEFRTVDTAIVTRISRAAPSAPRAPAYLGLSLEANSGRPAVVADVEPGSPAARAGVKPGDVLRAAAGQPVTDAAGLRDLLRDKGAGDEVKLAVLRRDKPVTLTVSLGTVSRPLTAGRRAILGIQVESAEDKGVRVTAITPGSPAAAAKLKVGDVIVKVDGTAVSGFDGLGSTLGTRRPGDAVTLAVRRDDKALEIKATLAAEGRPGQRRPRWDDRTTFTFRKPVYRLAVVAIEYPDVKHNDKVTTEDWDKALFSRGTYAGKSATGQKVYGSLYDYYKEQSCGALAVEGKVFDFVKVKRKRAEYGDGPNRFALFNEALDKVLARDGKDALKGFDGLFFLYAGDRVTTTRRGGLYWPHRASVSYKGQRWAYFICPEGGERMASISIIAHEFGHLLGLPDLYARPENPGSEGLGLWCTMSTGHGRDGKPLHFCAWSKEQMGWLAPAVIDPTVKQKLILSPVEDSRKECFKVLLRRDGSEYLLLENRVRKGFDRDLPGEGLLIWRVVNGRPVLEESHGITTPDGPMRFLGSIPYPSPANNAFTPYTTPSSKPAKGDGLPVHITNIRRLPDGRVTFFVGYEYI